MSKKVGDVMDDIGNAEAPPPPRVSRFGEGKEVKASRRVAGSQPALISRLVQFWHDVRAEMKRVSWPTATEVRNTTLITLVAVIFFAVYLFLVDRVWTFLLTQLNHLLAWITGS